MAVLGTGSKAALSRKLEADDLWKKRLAVVEDEMLLFAGLAVWLSGCLAVCA